MEDWAALMEEEVVLLLYEQLALLGQEILPQQVEEETVMEELLALVQRLVVLPVHLPKEPIEVDQRLAF